MARRNNTNGLLTARQVARLLNVHVNTVRRWNDRGILKAYRIGPRGDRRFLRDDVLSFLATKQYVNTFTDPSNNEVDNK